MTRRFLDTALATFFIVAMTAASCAGAGGRDVVYSTEDGGVIHATLFTASRKRAVVFAHGAVFNKESWFPLAETLQRAGVDGLAIDFRGYGTSEPGTSASKYYDVLGAVAYLKHQGYKRIGLVGGSMGGAAVLEALQRRASSQVDKVVLLAAASREPIVVESIDKLFVVSEGDRFRPQVEASYAASSEPKTLKKYPGAAHAQHLFRTEHGADLTRRIVAFLND